MFIDLNDLIEIKIFYKKSKISYMVLDEAKYEKLSDENKAKYKCLTIKAKPLNWGMYNDLNEESTIKDLNGNRVWSNKLYKENKMKKIVVSWDAVNKGVPVPVTPETLKSLAREIAEMILVEYEALTEITEEEEGK